jgi:DNA-binding Lrp family transcriptional regulator
MAEGFRDRLRLSEQEKTVLSHVEFRARTPIPEIARACGYKEPSVRYILAKLIECGVITDRRAFLNLSLLGFTSYALYIAVASWSEGDRESLSRFLSGAPRVSWFAEVGGEYQYALTYSGYDPTELIELRERVSKKFARVIARLAVATRVALWTFPRKYLATAPRKHAGWLQGGPHRAGIDATDAKVLSALSRGGLDSLRLLAERSEIPMSTFDRRVHDLEGKGIIQGYYYRINASAIGFEDFRLLIQSSDVSRDFTNGLLSFSRSHPNVRKFVQCISEWDYELEISVPSAREVSAVVASLNEGFRAEVGRVRIVPIFSEVNRPPLPEGWFSSVS